jgi:hypothetical protein
LEHAVVASYFHKNVVDDIARRDAVFMLPRLRKDIYNYIYPYILYSIADSVPFVKGMYSIIYRYNRYAPSMKRKI